MNVSLLNFLIIAIVLCFVSALIILIVSSKLNAMIGKIAAGTHAVVAGVVIYKLISHGTDSFSLAAWFSAFICSGILCFAFIIRKKFSLPVKIYFSLFILSFPMFLFAPSRVFTVMSLGLLSTENANEIHLKGNYFISREQGMIKHDAANSTYKVIKRMGIFNKTIARELHFNFTPDSATILFMDEKSEIRIRAFTRKQTGVDSMDVAVKTIGTRDTLLKVEKRN